MQERALNKGRPLNVGNAPSAVEKPVPLPPFGPKGYLPPGVHPASFRDLQRLTCTNSRRQGLWNKLTSFLIGPSYSGRFDAAFIGGGFVSSRPQPSDIDLILQTKDPFGPAAFEAIAPYFAVGLDKIAKIYDIHLHFWMEDAPRGFQDFRVFFQYERTDAAKKQAPPSRGIVQLDLRESNFLLDPER